MRRVTERERRSGPELVLPEGVRVERSDGSGVRQLGTEASREVEHGRADGRDGGREGGVAVLAVRRLSSGSLSLRDHPGETVRLVCERCGRRGQYRKTTLMDS